MIQSLLVNVDILGNFIFSGWCHKISNKGDPHLGTTDHKTVHIRSKCNMANHMILHKSASYHLKATTEIFKIHKTILY